MASPAAVLSVLVKADGIAKTNKQIMSTHSGLTKADKGAGKLRGTLSKFKGMSPIGGALAIGGAIHEVKAAVKETTALAKTTSGLAKNFGLTTKAASEWAAVAESRGIDGKQLTMGFKGLATATRGAVQGSKAQVQAFKELGISQQDLAKHGNDTNFMIHAVADGLKGLPAGTNRSAIQAKLFGRTWQTLSPLLRDGSAALDDQLQLADKYGATMDDKAVKGAMDAAGAQRELKLANIGFQHVLATAVLPAIVAVARGLADLIGWLRKNPAALKAVEIAVGVLAAGFLALNAVMLANPATLIVIGLAALAAGLVYAYQKSATFRKIVDAAFAAVKAAAAAVWDVVKVVFPAIGKAIVDAWMWVKTATTNVWGAVGPYLKGIFEVLKFLVKTYFLVYKTVILGVWTAVKTATELIWPVIKAIVVGVWAALKLAATVYWGAIKLLILTPIRAVRDVLAAIWPVIKTAATGAWGALKAAATTTWATIKTVILTPIRAVRDALPDIWDAMKKAASGAWDGIKKTAGTFAGDLKDKLVGAFKGAANAVIGFLNDIIRAINLIPGVPNIGLIKKLAEGGQHGGPGGPNGNGLARGGAFARTGGLVNRPMTFMGEEAPRHPEYVIPTNPAYRGRAQGLLAQAAGAIGMASGGIFNVQEMADLWRSKGGSATLADTMGVIGFVESHGDPNVMNPSGATGLWQILGQLVPGNLRDPGINALNAIAKYQAQGLHAWDASRSKWEPLLGKEGVGLLDRVSLSDLLAKLPGVGDLPDWFKGTGKWVLSHVGDWIKDKIASILPGGGGGGTTATGPTGVGTFEGLPMANWVIGALKYARGKGFTGHPTSGYRSHAENVAAGRNYYSEHEGTQYPHGAVDFGGFTSGLETKLAFVNAVADYKYPLIAPIGFRDDGHASGTGHRRGGVFSDAPFVGSYSTGGTLPADGLYYGHQGETVIPKGAGGPLVHVENLHVGSRNDENSLLERLAFKVATA